MQTLEVQVREALINQRAEELFSYASENPEKVNDFFETEKGSMAGSVASAFGGADKKKAAKIKCGFIKKVWPLMRALVSGPEELRQMTYEQARREYIPARELKAKISAELATISECGEPSNKSVAEYEKALAAGLEITRANDRIVKRLAKVAKTEGLDKAVQKETRYAVIREMFPTPKAYRAAFVQRGMEIAESLRQAHKALVSDWSKDPEDRMIVQAVFEYAGNALERSKTSYLQLQEERVKEIYRV